MTLQQHEGGNRLALGVAALVHDVHRLMEHECGHVVHPRESLERVSNILTNVPLSHEDLQLVLHLVEFHDDFLVEGGSVDPQCLELSLLQDADRLDAIGAIGIARCFMYGGAHKLPMWTPEIPLQNQFDGQSRDVSCIHHFYSKLLNLENTFFSHYARLLAKERTDLMKKFVEDFLDEWGK